MQCPKCQSDMETITYAEIEVDRCRRCKGIWFDMLEHEHLKDVEGSESIDIGNPELGKQYDYLRRVTCPSCSSQLIAMVDKDQPHIRFEACTSCYGVFFDAGEFKDYKEHNVLDFFKDLFTRARG